MVGYRNLFSLLLICTLMVAGCFSSDRNKDDEAEEYHDYAPTYYVSSAIDMGDSFIVGNGTGYLYSIRKDGKVYWQQKYEYNLAWDLSYDQGYVIVPVNEFPKLSDDDIVAFDAQTGEVVWVRRFNDDYSYNSLSFDGFTFAYAYDLNKIIALSSSTGEILWEFETEEYSTHSLLQYEGDLIFANNDPYSNSRHYYRINPETKKVVWHHQHDYFCGFKAYFENILICDGANFLYALDEATGELVWVSQEFIYSQDHYQVVPELGQIILVESDSIYKLDAYTGETLETKQMGTFYFSIASHNGRYLLWEYGSSLRLFDPETLTPASWNFGPGPYFYVEEPNIYVSSSNGYFYSLNLETRETNWVIKLHADNDNAVDLNLPHDFVE